ncbi:ABC transporter ATP-binding protein [Acidihalobacter ferrooxydans]|uniref:Peptide ABC transporter ATP-binding protein n=1 Tax=Acidihalobacter ferrooxydans TaxID=1765967 RepID=A0A1P8UDC8_9GAMM|nr:oligopeptide/dipeptide ABC transporter ATP-binding protein [Acidihalobacter ferrooxydans]APZ41796.1 peptide ABC transporter ATP-binding protein [Acidihalobacter ferrooxydans]
MSTATPILQVDNLRKTFGDGKTLLRKPKPQVHAVQNVEFAVQPGETLGIVGESGCGKSTLARMLVGLSRPSGGSITIEGRDMAALKHAGTRATGRMIQYVFQDPLSSLNPRKTIREIIEAPLIHLHGMGKQARSKRIAELMDAVNLRPEFLDRYPHEFSGGQAQRIGIARALAADARILVLDEPVSALDVSVQAQVLNLLRELRREFDLTYLFISHDLAVVEAISERVAVMYFGHIVEIGAAEQVFARPRHPYTRLLLDSAPSIDKARTVHDKTLAELPDPLNPPPGCPFAPRCPHADARCRTEIPALSQHENSQAAACFHPLSFPGG